MKEVVCVECGANVPSLYVQYSKGNIKLTQCTNCGTFADKYIENDIVIVFLDMILHKRSVYRHLLCNRIKFGRNGLNSDIVKLGVILILFEVYLKWFKLEQHHGRSDFLTGVSSVFHQYMYILTISILETLVWHGAIRLVVPLAMRRRFSFEFMNRISMATTVSSFGKLLLILMVIWDYGDLKYTWLVSLLVLRSNLEALSALLNASYSKTALILLAGLACRWVASLLIRQHNPAFIIII